MIKTYLMKNTLWMLLAIIVLSSCTGNDKQAQADDDNNIIEETDSLKTGNELNDQTIATLDKSPIFRSARSTVSEFNWNRFQLTRFWKEDSLLTRSFEPEQGYYDNYGPLFKYSPDSTKFIDLDSYNISIRKNNKGQRIGEPQGPDTEVSLVDLKKKQVSRLIFLGPGNNIEDAAWQDNENLLLVSSVDNTDAAANASVIKYNLPSKTFYVYETADSSIVNHLKGYWRKERLKNIIFK
jgi:hypothetical protein